MRLTKNAVPAAKKVVLAALTLLPAALAAQPARPPAAEAEARTRYTLNDGWKFTLGGVEFAEKATVSDAGWENVTVPHTWNAHDIFDDVPSYRRGTAWYRRTLALDPSLRGRRLYLYFEGVNQTADVYVNGAFAGGHRGGYTAFTVDITDRVRWDSTGHGTNLVAVQVDNAHDPQVPPLSVGFGLYGGIYRDVWLVSTDPVHVTMADHGGPGIAVTTPAVSRERGEVRVAGTIDNAAGDARRLRIVSTVTDAAGATVSTATSTISVAAGASGSFASTLPAVRTPHLWSPDDPYLYAVRTDVYDGDRLVDRVRNPLGFRWFRFDPQQGFFLNGSRLELRGTNRHQDREGYGSALSNRQHVQDLEIIKDMGANFLRLAHYPQDPAVLEAADRLGLLVWEEVPVVNYVTISGEFERNSQEMLREMIRQHRNHPSVILWGVMNEVFLWGPEAARIGRQNDTTYMREVRDFARGMDRIARAEDPDRLTTMAIHGSADYDLSGVSEVTQVLGLNVYDGWYSGTFEGFGAGLDRRHARMPDRILFVSEYGSGSDLRLNSLHPERFDHSSTWHRLYHESYLRQTRARPWLGGTAIWNQFDFSQPHIGESMPQMNQKGMLTFDRTPKDVFFMYRANWNPQPMVYVASRDWTRRTGTRADAPRGAGPVAVNQPIDVYSNLDRVELFANGASLGVRTPDDVKKASWDVPFVDGDNVIEARGTKDGRVLTDRLVIHFRYYASDLRDPSVPFREMAVNVGSNAQFVDDDGLIWEADQAYVPGGFGALGGERKLMGRDVVVTGSAKTGMLVTYREGLEGYRFDVPDGAYEVELVFAEPSETQSGKRVFGVEVNGRTVADRMDTGAVGLGRAAPVTVETVAAGEGIVVRFVPVAGQPVLNGIRVRRH